MKSAFRFITVLLCITVTTSFSPIKKYVKKGKLSLERGEIPKAKKYFTKALEIDSTSFPAHFGIGIMYSEVLEDFTTALPYLKKAYEYRPLNDSLFDLLYALAKSYHHDGEYDKAMEFYNRMANRVDPYNEFNFEFDLEKRKQDCQYAMAHEKDPVPPNILVINAGRTLNTDQPEYVPVITPQQEIIFTSKRQDEEDEKINFMDGKYFESMYIAKITPNGFTQLRRYNLPDQVTDNKFFKRHQSVVSLSQDGKNLLTFKEGTIYEVAMDARATSAPEELVITDDKQSYQNHAFLCRDNKTVYFTSEVKGGLGGLDIYVSVKDEKGNWSKPQNLGENVNTKFDEDAPFLSLDGRTLYFSSKGHEGFGNHDIYKSEIIDGKYGKAVNLGAPFNSPAHDVFLVTDSVQFTSYFSSGRKGGRGDLDIYKILDLDKMSKECPAEPGGLLSFSTVDADSTDHSNIVVAELPAFHKVLEYSWKVNDQSSAGTATSLTHDYKAPGDYTVSLKMMVLCDSCLAPVIVCGDYVNKIDPKTRAGEPLVTTPSSSTSIGDARGQLTDEQLANAGFNTSPVLFAFDKSKLGFRSTKILKHNVEILKKYPDLNIELYGYTDSRGTDWYNLMLSKRRARSVKNFLVRNGIDKSRVVLVDGKGSNELVNDCGKDKKCPENLHRMNRRVVVIVKKNILD